LKVHKRALRTPPACAPFVNPPPVVLADSVDTAFAAIRTAMTVATLSLEIRGFVTVMPYLYNVKIMVLTGAITVKAKFCDKRRASGRDLIKTAGVSRDIGFLTSRTRSVEQHGEHEGI
jgi:hypothetical protein